MAKRSTAYSLPDDASRFKRSDRSLLMAHLLLVDDDDLLRRSLAFNLEKAGYRVSVAANAEDALLHSQQQRPDLVVLDIGLPGMDGLEALRQFRERFSVPIIFLTARRREFDQVLGLELGADDYVTKPFDFDVLAARIKAVLRRAQETVKSTSQQPGLLTVGDLTIDAPAHTVTLKGQFLDLPPREFDLLYALALSAGRVVSADDLIARVWGAEYDGEPQVVYVHIRWLREKIEDDPNHPRRIITVRSVGYKLEPQAPNVPHTAQPLHRQSHPTSPDYRAADRHRLDLPVGNAYPDTHASE